MGLMVHSIAKMPKHSEKDYYIYLLDYGWKGSLGAVLFENFDKLSSYASENNFVVLRGTPGSHFEDEVFSWHGINGDSDPDLLPSILITTINPHYFSRDRAEPAAKENEYMLLIPLKRTCKSESDVSDLIDKLIKNILSKDNLRDFSIVKTTKKSKLKAAISCIILQPNIAGIGVDLKNIPKLFTDK
jgi:hypothetical protein